MMQSIQAFSQSLRQTSYFTCSGKTADMRKLVMLVMLRIEFLIRQNEINRTIFKRLIG